MQLCHCKDLFYNLKHLKDTFTLNILVHKNLAETYSKLTLSHIEECVYHLRHVTLNIFKYQKHVTRVIKALEGMSANYLSLSLNDVHKPTLIINIDILRTLIFLSGVKNQEFD